MKDLSDGEFNSVLHGKFHRLTEFLSDPKFLQIGAADGKLAENLHDTFMQSDWRAVMLEPLPDMFEKLRETYASKPKFRLVNAALAPYDGFANIRRIPPESVRDDELWAHGISSMDGTRSSFTEGPVPPGVAVELTSRSRLERVVTMTFETLRRQTDLDRIDYLQIDTEGYDLIALRQIDLVRYRPFLINCEIFNLSLSDRAEVFGHLQRHGYSLTISEWDVMGSVF